MESVFAEDFFAAAEATLLSEALEFFGFLEDMIVF